MIVSLLKSGNIDFSEIKMFAIYGNWGSGKSTLMKYMQQQLQKEDFQTFYFDAWQYENGKDLSFSLLEFMTDTGLKKGEKTANNILEIGERILIGAAKSVSFSLPGFNINPKELLNEIDKKPRVSFHTEIENFKEEFKNLENQILTTTKPHKKTNIVFIDDLDRCEPEKVLDLLSEIKLFFSYGERTIFFFGVDEKAVQAAIKNKYGDVVKSNEYLEKVFDLDFKISQSTNSNKLLSDFFINKMSIQTNLVKEFILPLFGQLSYNNPRKVKKILNKYLLTLEYKRIHPNDLLVPNLKNHSTGSFLQTILSLYFIILKDFYPDKLVDFKDFKTKKFNYMNAHKLYAENFNVSNNAYYFDHLITRNALIDSIFKTLKKCKEENDFSRFLIMFAPKNINAIGLNSLKLHKDFETFIPIDSDIFFRMTYFLIAIFLPKYELDESDDSDYKFIDLVSYVEKYV